MPTCASDFILLTVFALKDAQVWDFRSHGFSRFLYQKASMGRRLWDCNKKRNYLVLVMISKLFPQNFELVHAEHAPKKIWGELDQKSKLLLVPFEPIWKFPKIFFLIFTLWAFLLVLKNRKFIAFFSACSACVAHFLAPTQHA